VSAEKAPPRPAHPPRGIVIGVVEFAWIFDRGREWAANLFLEWEREQQRGGPVRVFRKGRVLMTTSPVLHQWMPPGRDRALYKRVEAVEGEVAQAHKRIDRVAEEVGEVRRRVGALEGQRFGRRAG
jgi:hypothetical protein